MRTASLFPRRFLTIALLLASPLLIQAGSIGINFSNGARELSSTDEPGVVPGANWNNAVGTTGTVANLVNDIGNSTGASLSYSAFGAYDLFPYPNTPNTATNLLYKGGLYENVIVQISNIPYAAYDVYTYAGTVDGTGGKDSITDGTTTFCYQSVPAEYTGDGNVMAGVTSLTRTTSTDSNNPTMAMSQYQIFSDETAQTLTITLAPGVVNQYSDNLFGVQIVESMPEPASFLLLAGGFGALAPIPRSLRGRG